VKFPKSNAEDTALSWLGELDYAILHGPEIAPDESRTLAALLPKLPLAGLRVCAAERVEAS
jgi:hypothetical protein